MFLDGLRAVADDVVDPSFEHVNRTPAGAAGMVGFSGTIVGFEAFVDWWKDWLAGYDAFKIEIQDVIEHDTSVPSCCG